MTSPPPETDELLTSFVAFFHANVDSAFNVAFRLVWNRADAQDVVQNSFLQAFRHWDQLRDPTKARSWLLRITYREALMVLRRRRDEPTDPADLPDRPTEGDDPADRAVNAELADLIRAAINNLPDTLRMAVVLRDVERLSMREVAEILDVGTSAAKMRVTRARAQLRAALAQRI